MLVHCMKWLKLNEQLIEKSMIVVFLTNSNKICTMFFCLLLFYTCALHEVVEADTALSYFTHRVYLPKCLSIYLSAASKNEFYNQ